MNILVLNGSPRVEGNTSAHVAAFAEGAQSAGHQVTVIQVGTKKISGCMDCGYCRGRGNNTCAIMDDMQQVYQAMENADMIVIASPIYHWSLTGQMQSTITRFYAPRFPRAKKYALILSSGSNGVYDAPISQMRSVVSYFGAELVGIRTVYGTNNKSQRTLEEMRSFGASL